MSRLVPPIPAFLNPMPATPSPTRPRRPRTRRARAPLDDGFYAGLLHLAGLRECAAGSGRGVTRREPHERQRGTLVELALERIAAHAPASLDEPARFALALRLCIAWISQLVLLKVLETRLLALHDGNTVHALLHASRLRSFRDLGALCDAVFGGGSDARFAQLPRLDAVRFCTDLDARLVDIGALDDSATLTPFGRTQHAGETHLLPHLLDFFAAFDFSSGIVARSRDATPARPCIDAAALGLVFEKLNGYRDGAWYTPASVAMELARAAVTRAVLNRSAQAGQTGKAHQSPLTSLDQLSESIVDRDTVREIFDTLRVCDPAVGSGHLLVSALNEVLALKARFGLLAALGDARLVVVADRLHVTHANGEPFCAQRDRAALREIDAMLYREKRRIVARTLFGVDISEDAVCMARMRLAIELLEHANFSDFGDFGDRRDPVTRAASSPLPNLAANLRQGNAALSDIGIDTPSREGGATFAWTREFPALCASNGASNGGFEGFDAVIANPPYIDSERMINAGQKPLREALARRWPSAKGNWDLYIVFMELGLALLKPGGAMAYLTPDKWLAKPFGEAFRARHLRKIERIVTLGREIFDEARVDAIVTIFRANDLDAITTARLGPASLVELARADPSTLAAPWMLDALLSPHYAFARRVMRAHPPLGALLRCENACATADAYRLAPLIEEAADVESERAARCYRVVNTGTLARYVSRWGAKPMTYLGRRYDAPVVDHARFAATFANGYGAKAGAKKVIVKGLTRLDASLDLAGDTIPGKTTLVLRGDDENRLKFAAALLNCPLSAFLLREQYGASSYNGGVAFTKAMIDALPAPADPALHARVVMLVDRLLACADAHEAGRASAITIANQIDAAFYAAFALTEEEIALVEDRASTRIVQG
ncbi:Eco57I restriction-modification methylase domain-containing protein [Paraburkholderia sp. J41]|uniref:Eco57I restriction-modification methylase domain-containing protein n=1 Tax=Paraburkholderia sp. J41 TaxID=2805433 RepID=UPI002AC3281A|nr:Eco57I restriction-modification methylase domain-containing protein [Paraburkholderia sp. J41]